MQEDDNISHRSLINVTHIRATASNPDLHVVKERIYYKDGSEKPHTYLIEDYKVPFYITLPQHRTFKQHKERAPLHQLAKHQSTVSALPNAISRALGNRWSTGRLRDVCNSPYVFGAQLSSLVRIRRDYATKWPVPPKPLRYAAYDLETSVVDEEGAIIIASIAFQTQVKVFIRSDFLDGCPDQLEYFAKAKEHMGEHGFTDLIKGIDFSYEVLPTELDVIKALAKAMFEFDVDVVGAWNHEFDVCKLIARCEALRVNPADIFSDPIVPPPARRFKFIEGSRIKMSVTGKTRSLQPSEQWHNIHATSGFLWLDAMCVYRRLRFASAFLPSYSLDAIAKLHLGIGKLETEETKHMDSLSRHIHMQTKDKLTYCLYAGLDVLEMILLDKKINDITLRLPIELAGSDYRDASKASARTSDMFSMALEEDGYIFGTVGSEPDKFPKDVLPLSGWPLSLPNNLHATPGISAVAELPDYATNIYTCNLTTDLTSAYPNLIYALNISKETTRYEMVEIEGAHCDKLTIYHQNMNLFGGKVNALDYCQLVYGYPSLDQIDQLLSTLKH